MYVWHLECLTGSWECKQLFAHACVSFVQDGEEAIYYRRIDLNNLLSGERGFQSDLKERQILRTDTCTFLFFISIFQSRFVRNANPTFIFGVRRDVVDPKLLRKDQIVNHYGRATFTTKVRKYKNFAHFSTCTCVHVHLHHAYMYLYMYTFM